MTAGRGRIAGYRQLGAGKCYVATDGALPGMNAMLRPELGKHVYLACIAPDVERSYTLQDGDEVVFMPVSSAAVRVTGMR